MRKAFHVFSRVICWLLLLLTYNIAAYAQTESQKTINDADIAEKIEIKDGFVWAKTNAILKKEKRGNSLQTIGFAIDEKAEEKVQANKSDNGILIGDGNVVYFSYPFNRAMIQEVAAYVVSLGKKPLTRAQEMVFILKQQQPKKTHLFNNKIAKREWDY